MANQTTVDQELIRIENAKTTFTEKAVEMKLYYPVGDGDTSQDCYVGFNDDGTPKDAIEDIAEAFDIIPMKSSDDLSVNGIQVSVPPGYYSEYAYKMVDEAQQAIPTISINPDTGLITVTAVQEQGYVGSGTKTVTEQISHTNLTADNIKTGKSVFGVAGTFTKIDGSDGKMPVESRYMVDGFSGFVNGNRVDGTATNFNAVEENISLYYKENNQFKKTETWTLEEGFVKNVSLVFNDSALVERLKKI